MDTVLEKTITIFRYITDKDVFERYYKAHLAKRLLQNRSVSDDAERNMIAKLKVECGFHFTQKLEGMFTDMKVSADTMLVYKKHLETTTVISIPRKYLARQLANIYCGVCLGTRAGNFCDDPNFTQMAKHVNAKPANVHPPEHHVESNAGVRDALPVSAHWATAHVAAWVG